MRLDWLSGVHGGSAHWRRCLCGRSGRSRSSNGRRRCDSRCRGTRYRRVSLALMFARVCCGTHFHTALEFRPIFNGDTRSFEVAFHAARRTEYDAFAPTKIAIHGSANCHFTGFNAGLDAPALPDCQPRFNQANTAVDFAVDNQICLARKLALDANSARKDSRIRRQ